MCAYIHTWEVVKVAQAVQTLGERIKGRMKTREQCGYFHLDSLTQAFPDDSVVLRHPFSLTRASLLLLRP